MKFKVGDTVFWRSSLRGPKLDTGTITKIYVQESSNRYRVLWNDGPTNNCDYTHGEMEILSKEAPIGYQDFCDKIKDRLR